MIGSRLGHPLAEFAVAAAETLAASLSPQAVSLSIPVATVTVGLVGLAVTDDDPIERLTRKVRRAVAGEDVDFGVDRDGDVGELATAIEDLVEAKDDRERELKRERDRFEALFENLPNPSYRAVAEEGEPVVREVNEAFEDTFGYDEAELRGEKVHDYIAPDADDAQLEALNRKVLDGGDLPTEVRRRTADGERIFRMDVGLNEPEEGPPEGYTIYTDVTERAQHERELERHREYTEDLLDAVDDVFYVLDEDGSLQRWNEALVDATGYDEEEIESMHALDFFAEDDRPRIAAAIDDVFETGDTRVEADFLTATGQRVPYEFVAVALEDPDGNPVLTGIGRDIGDRKERERELERQASLLDSLFERMPVSIYVKDTEGRHVHTSTAHLRDEYPDEEEWFQGKTDRDIYSGDLAEESFADDMQVIERGEPIVDKEEYNPDTGEWLLTSKVPWRDEDGEVRGLIGISQRINEQKERERELRETKRRLEIALEGTNTGIWEWDVETDDITWNEPLEKLLGLEPGSFDGSYEAFASRVHSEDRSRVETALETAVENDASYRTEFRMRREDGDLIWLSARGRLVSDENGDRRMVGIVHDVTERKRRERQLRDREDALERYREYTEDVLDAIDDVFYIVDEDWRIRRWNESLEDVTGFAADELEGTHVREFFDPDDAERIVAALEDIDDRVGQPQEAAIRTDDGESIPYEFVAAPLVNHDGDRVVAGIGRDITERKRYETELERTTHLLRQSGRLAGVGGWVLDVGPEDTLDATWTEQVYRIFDLPTDADLSLERAMGFLHPEDRQAVRERLNRTIENGDSTTIEAKLTSATGNERWVRAIAEPVEEDGRVVAIHGSVQDVTEQKEREAELERTRELLQQAGRMAEFGGWELDVTASPPEMTWTDELYDIHGVDRDTRIDVETALSHYHPDDRDYIEEQLRLARDHGRGYDMEVRALTTDGEIRWVRALGEAVEEDGEVVKLCGAIQDITDQKEREFALESLHESTRGLLNAEAAPEGARLVVDAAEDALDVTAVGIFLYDEETNRLLPTAVSAAMEEYCSGDPTAVGPDDESFLWHSFVTDSQTVVEDAAAGAGGPFFESIDNGLVMPIGAHGAFLAVTDGATLDADTRRLAETLVASAEAAFDRIESEQRLRERDEELEARNERLRRQIRVTETIRSIDRTLIGATSQASLEADVCEQLVEGDTIDFAWIGGFDAAGETLTPRTWAGEGSGYLDDAVLERSATSPDPAVDAAVTGSPTAVGNVGENVRDEPWRRRALAANFQSALAVPLALDEYRYGVLAVYTAEPHAFGDLERTVFAELGESIANAIASVSTRQALHSDTVVSLSLRLENCGDPLTGLAAAIDGEVEYEGLATHTDDAARLFVRATGADAATIREALDARHAIADYRRISEGDDGTLSEVTLSGDSLVAKLLRHGGHPRSITADPDGLDVVVELPVSADVRAFVSMLEEDYEVELRRRREENRSLETHQSVVDAMLGDLTERQREVLRTAHLAGFFNWPRDVTGEELAEMLDVSQPTVNRHLRLAERRIMAELFEGEPAVE